VSLRPQRLAGAFYSALSTFYFFTHNQITKLPNLGRVLRDLLGMTLDDLG